MATSTTLTNTGKQIHFILQGKGGCGKTISSLMLAQVLNDRGSLVCFDTDPINASLSQYQGINSKIVEIMEDNRVDPRRFDKLIEDIIKSDVANIVVDTGSQSFIELSAYLVDNEVFEFLIDKGFTVYSHVIINGGAAIQDTLNGLVSVIESFPENIKLTVWLNEYFGKIETDGKSFQEMKVYREYADRFHALVRLPKENTQTTERDITDMLQRHQTFDEAIASEDTFIMAKQRLTNARNSIFNSINNALDGKADATA